MPVTVPYEVITTGNAVLDRVQNNTSQAIRRLQDQVQPPQSSRTKSSITLGRQTSVTVTEEAASSVTVSLPNRPPGQQQTRIVNLSAYPVHVRTADSLTVFGDIKPGSSLTVYSDGTSWSA